MRSFTTLWVCFLVQKNRQHPCWQHPLLAPGRETQEEPLAVFGVFCTLQTPSAPKPNSQLCYPSTAENGDKSSSPSGSAARTAPEWITWSYCPKVPRSWRMATPCQGLSPCGQLGKLQSTHPFPAAALTGENDNAHGIFYSFRQGWTPTMQSHLEAVCNYFAMLGTDL